MAVQTVACPGCNSTLKASEQMIGKKAKCKKCGTSFRIPGSDEPAGETVGESQFLSAMDLPTPAASSPFDFDHPEPKPEPKPKPPEKPRKSDSKPAEKPIAKAPPEKLPARKSKVEEPEKEAEEEEEVIPAAAPVEEDVPAADPLSFDEADELPAAPPEASGDPFAFSSQPEKSKPAAPKKERAPEPAAAGDPFSFSEEPAPKAKSKKSPREDSDDPPPEKSEQKTEKRGYRAKPAASGGIGAGTILIAAVVFAVIVGGIVGGVLIYLYSGNKSPEPTNNEKKDEKPADPTSPEPVPPGKTPDTPKDPPPKKKDPGGKKPNTPGGPMLGLAPGKPIALLPQAAKLESAQTPNNRLLVVPTLPGKVDSAFGAARRVFPPVVRDTDIGVLWQTEAGFQDSGQKLLLGLYSPQTGKQANQITVDGDGSPEPACDLSENASVFAHAHTLSNKVTVWDTRGATKLVDGFNPYAEKKDLKLAAVYLTEPPKFFITVSTSGAVHAFNIDTKEPMPGEFVPAKPPTKPLVAGKHIAPGPKRQSVVLFVSGSFYKIEIGPKVTGSEIVRLDGDVGRSFGIAISGSNKLVFAFETDDGGKKEKAVMEVRDDGKHVVHRWPEKEAGEPNVVGWVGDRLAMIGSNRGACIWFESEGQAFKPVGLARTPNDKGIHVASDGHWTLLPDAGDPKQCVLVEYSNPQSSLVGVFNEVKGTPSTLLTDKALLK